MESVRVVGVISPRHSSFPGGISAQIRGGATTDVSIRLSYLALGCPTAVSSTNRKLRAVEVTEAGFTRDQCHALLMQLGSDNWDIGIRALVPWASLRSAPESEEQNYAC